MKKLVTVFALLIFACNIIGCGGGGGGSSTTTTVTPIALDTETGKNNNIYITDNNDITDAISSAMLVNSPNIADFATASAPVLKSISFSPQYAAKSRSGTYRGHPYNLTVSINVYNKNNLLVNSVNSPDELGKLTLTLTGYVGNVTLTATDTFDNFNTTLYDKNKNIWIFSCRMISVLNITNGSKSFTYNGTFTTNYNVSETNVSASQTGTITMDFGNGWALTANIANGNATGSIQKNGIIEGTISITNGSCTITDSETNDNIIINSNGITYNTNIINPFSGTWTGTWEQVQYGTLSLKVESNGNTTGTVFNTSTGKTGNLKGFVNRNGEFSAYNNYPNYGTYVMVGTLSLNNLKTTMQCNFVNVYNGQRSTPGSSNLIKQ